MKIDDGLLGKEVIDASGDKIGVVKDVEWDFNSKKVEAIELKEESISSKIGLGENKTVPINEVKEIGDRVLIKTRVYK
jgi:sporulation protein YlmC with PRC-barrel domain